MKTNFLLKLNTKKIFFFVLITPIIIQLILINLIQLIQNEIIYYLSFLLFGLLYLPYFYWLNIVIHYLYLNSNKYFKLKIENFKISLIINILVLFNFVFFVAYIFSFLFFKKGSPDTEIVVCLVFIQFIGVASFAYNNYFVSKLISTIKFNREAYFNDISSSLVTLFFPPLAIWVIHNQVKNIYESKKYDSNRNLRK